MARPYLGALLPTTPVKESSPNNFWGWYKETAAPYGTAFTAYTPVTADITVYARWEATPPEYWTVTFDTDGGNTVSPIQVLKTEAAGDLPTPTKSNSNFDGWYTAKNGGGTEFTKTTVPTANITVYASWATATTPGGELGGIGGQTTGQATITINATLEGDGASSVTIPEQNIESYGKWSVTDGKLKATLNAPSSAETDPISDMLSPGSGAENFFGSVTGTNAVSVSDNTASIAMLDGFGYNQYWIDRSLETGDNESNYQLKQIYYVYVDKDVTLSRAKKTISVDVGGGMSYSVTYSAFNLPAKAGWNLVQMDMNAANFTITIKVADKDIPWTLEGGSTEDPGGKDPGEGGYTKPLDPNGTLEGTWTEGVNKIVADSDSNWVYTTSGLEVMKGTYLKNTNSIPMTITHVALTWLPGGVAVWTPWGSLTEYQKKVLELPTDSLPVSIYTDGTCEIGPQTFVKSK